MECATGPISFWRDGSMPRLMISKDPERMHCTVLSLRNDCGFIQETYMMEDAIIEIAREHNFDEHFPCAVRGQFDSGTRHAVVAWRKSGTTQCTDCQGRLIPLERELTLMRCMVGGGKKQYASALYHHMQKAHHRPAQFS